VDLASLWRLKNLTDLYLSNNKLSVTDGNSSTYLPGLRVLALANCNITKIPNFLTGINHLSYLDISSNKINGNIPKWIWERWNSSLESLNLSHNMFTGMELTSYVIPFSRPLYTLDLSSNRLQGQIPLPSLSAKFMDYSDNMFSSVLPNFTLYLSQTHYLSLSNNNISSYLPNSICDSYIDILDVSYNRFKGMVPPCLMGNGFMTILNLRENHFEGVLPSNISSGCSLQTLNLNGNKIEGQLPRALYNCTNLEVLDLGRNQIMDTFPSWLRTLPNLRVLVLRSNQFHGSIQDEKSGENFPSLQILDLASNNFSGNLHPRWFKDLTSMEKYNNTGQLMEHQNISIHEFYQDTVTISYKGSFVTFERILTTLTAIDLSNNALEGSIPASIGKLVSLRALNMSHNSFTGEIPHLFGGMAALESLDLSSNILSGEIPQELTNLTFLSILNLSNNQLEGRIPQSRQFATFRNDSFDGNARLCGSPLSKQCGTPDNPNGTHLKQLP
jgi:Leucine-rich repeat (LRR) protein